MLLNTLFVLAAVAADPPAWKDAPADVVAEAHFDVPPAAVRDVLDDLSTLSPVFPTDCAEDWVLGSVTSGADATARVTVRAAGLRRRLTTRYNDVDSPAVIELDYVGKKGFFTQFRLDEAEGGTDVTLITYLQQPAWPLKRYFVFKVHPAWTSCHERTLDGLAEALRR
ncbi:MAG: hypothetical protein ACI8PZ_003384 [Myxococcota bacterium]|jgi:hypothetical protein